MFKVDKTLTELAAEVAAPLWHLCHEDGSIYLERLVLRGSDCLDTHGGDYHIFVHAIHTPDSDRHPHSHPFAPCSALVLAGGYTETRADGTRRTYRPGDINYLAPGDYHSIVEVLPNTVTLFLAGPETQGWGFLVDGVHVPHAKYFKRADAHHMTHKRVA